MKKSAAFSKILPILISSLIFGVALKNSAFATVDMGIKEDEKSFDFSFTVPKNAEDDSLSTIEEQEDAEDDSLSTIEEQEDAEDDSLSTIEEQEDVEDVPNTGLFVKNVDYSVNQNVIFLPLLVFAASFLLILFVELLAKKTTRKTRKMSIAVPDWKIMVIPAVFGIAVATPVFITRTLPSLAAEKNTLNPYTISINDLKENTTLEKNDAILERVIEFTINSDNPTGYTVNLSSEKHDFTTTSGDKITEIANETTAEEFAASDKSVYAFKIDDSGYYYPANMVSFSSSTSESDGVKYAITLVVNPTETTEQKNYSLDGGFKLTAKTNNIDDLFDYYELKYDLNGGEIETSTSLQFKQLVYIPASTTITETVAEEVPTRAYYNFKGWNTKSDGTGTAYSAGDDIELNQNNKSITLYAQWQIESFTITFKNYDGTILQTGTWDYGITPQYSLQGQIAIPTRPDSSDGTTKYTFSGWNPSITTVTEDMTYTAQYTEQTIEVGATDLCEGKDTLQGITNNYIDMSMNLEEIVTLCDTRDGKDYEVAKFPNGTVLMIQNLDLDLSTNITLTSDDTNITTDWTPIHTTTTRSKVVFSAYDPVTQPFSYDAGNRTDGNYYNWAAAIAVNDSSSIEGDVTTSICPKGWRLPRATIVEEHATYSVRTDDLGDAIMSNSYGYRNSSVLGNYMFVRDKFENSIANLPAVGIYTIGGGDANGLSSYDKAGWYWQSQTIDANNAKTMSVMKTDENGNRYSSGEIFTDLVSGSSMSKQFAISIRCMADPAE